jgi:hypothetical protein
LAERLDRGFEAFKECRANISQPPTTYLKQFYYDTVNFDSRAIELAIAFAGPDHILAGSDYPHQIGSIPKMLASVHAVNASEDVKRKFWGRTQRGCWVLWSRGSARGCEHYCTLLSVLNTLRVHTEDGRGCTDTIQTFRRHTS